MSTVVVRRLFTAPAAALGVAGLAVPVVGLAGSTADALCTPDPAARRSVVLTALNGATHDALRFDATVMFAAAVTSCGVEVLPNCRLAVRVEFEGEAPTESTLRIISAQKLREAVPTASGDLLHNLGKVEGGEVRTLAVGRRTLSRPLVFAHEVVGDCKRATHLVSQVVYGAVEVRGPGPSRDIYDGSGDPEACGSPGPDGALPAADCREPVAATLTRLAPNVLVAPHAHDASACKPDDTVGCATACAVGNASACTSFARQLERASAQVASAAQVAPAAQAVESAVGAKGPQVAAALYAASCLAGQNLACNNLGVMREQGTGGAQDRSQAAMLYDAACKGGLVRACNNLGTLMRDGKGRPANPVESLALFHGACADGEPAACVNLGQQQLAGLGMPPDAVAAMESFRKSCEAGESLGCRNLLVAAKVSNRLPEATAALVKACDTGAAGACAAAEELRGALPPQGDAK
jgi:hypothetical protein